MRTRQRKPERGTVIPEDPRFRQVTYGRKPNKYRIIYRVDHGRLVVTVVHVRHSARDAWNPGPDYLDT